MPYLTLAGLLACAALAGSACSRPAADRPPYVCDGCNVVLISADTVRADHLGAYGYDKPTSPVVDALAARGVIFENAMAQSSWTRPAHMSIFTGLYPSEHGYVALMDRKRLPDAVPTLAGTLREHGYATAAFHGGINMDAAFGFDQGFDLYRTNGKYFRDNLEETKGWLDDHAGGKFFLFWHGYDAHTPYMSDPVDRIALGLSEHTPRRSFRRVCRDTARNRTAIRPYEAEYDAGIHRADRYAGKLLAHLDALGVRERTIILFTSDHGEEFMEHGGCFHLNTLYQEVLHVPLVVTAPGLAPARRTQLVPASVSIGATILELAGIRDHRLPGPSLAGLALGGSAPDTAVVSETMRRMDRRRGEGHVRALQRGDDKLIHWITQRRFGYFDLEHDPHEMHPAADGPPAALRERLEQWAALHPPFESIAGAPAQPAPSAAGEGDLDDRLRALGYVD